MSLLFIIFSLPSSSTIASQFNDAALPRALLDLQRKSCCRRRSGGLAASWMLAARCDLCLAFVGKENLDDFFHLKDHFQNEWYRHIDHAENENLIAASSPKLVSLVD